MAELERFFERSDPEIPRNIDLELAKRSYVRSGPIAPAFGHRQDLNAHRDMLFREFSGQPNLCYYHAYYNVQIRRNIDQPGAIKNFFRMWDQDAEFLIRRLNMRWLISACDTFADFGRSDAERHAGLLGAVLSNVCKLYETERSLTGHEIASTALDGSQSLFDGMTLFALSSGDMIKNLMRRISEPSISATAPGKILKELAIRLHAHDSVFRRFARVHTRDGTRWTSSGKRVALFNDTSRSNHYGCEMVSKVLGDLLEGWNANVIYRHYVGDNWRLDRLAEAAIDDADVIIVNAEGSIHHSSERAQSLASLGPYCRDRGKPAYLINATLQNNSSGIYENIASFRGVWVRETASSEALGAYGIQHLICPDLSLLANYPQGGEPVRELLLTDSVHGPSIEILTAFSRRSGLPVVSMKRDPQTGLSMVANSSPPPDKFPVVDDRAIECSTSNAFAIYLAQHRRIITGRYRAACMAIAMNIPLHALPSNTFKIEAMIGDIGLDPSRMLGNRATAASIPDHQPFTAEELTAITTYRARARAEADRMMAEILCF